MKKITNSYVTYHILDKGVATISITVLSGWTMAFFSLFRTSQFNSRQERSPLIVVMHVFFLGPAILFYKNWKNRANPDPLLEKDLFKIRYLEGTLEAAPQVITYFLKLKIIGGIKETNQNHSFFLKCQFSSNVDT